MDSSLDKNATNSRGFSLSLGSLPKHILLLPGNLKYILETLIEISKTHQDIETKRNACISISSVFTKLDEQEWKENFQFFAPIFDTLLLACDNYHRDDRGDVGSWVREASINSFLSVLTHLSFFIEKSIFWSQDLSLILSNCLLKQIGGKLDKLRVVAGNVFDCFVNKEENFFFSSFLKNISFLRELFPPSFTWNENDLVFQKLVNLISLDEYRENVLTRFLLCIHQNDKIASILFDFLNVLQRKMVVNDEKNSILFLISEDLANIMSKYHKDSFNMESILVSVDKIIKTSVFDCFVRPNFLFSANVNKWTYYCMKNDPTNVKILKPCISLFSSLLVFKEVTRPRSLQFIVDFLSHSYPVVRKHAAQVLLFSSYVFDDLVSPNFSVHFTQILSSDTWDQKFSEETENNISLVKKYLDLPINN